MMAFMSSYQSVRLLSVKSNPRQPLAALYAIPNAQKENIEARVVYNTVPILVVNPSDYKGKNIFDNDKFTSPDRTKMTIEHVLKIIGINVVVPNIEDQSPTILGKTCLFSESQAQKQFDIIQNFVRLDCEEVPLEPAEGKSIYSLTQRLKSWSIKLTKRQDINHFDTICHSDEVKCTFRSMRSLLKFIYGMKSNQKDDKTKIG